MSIFKELAEKAGVKTRTTLRILPERVKTSGPRTGAHLTQAASEAGNCFWRNAVEVAKVVYTAIDKRYADLLSDPRQVKLHRMRMAEAKKILQENRNQIFEAVLPLFDVYRRQPGDEWVAEDPNSKDGQSADKHAYDYFCQNVFPVMVRTYIDWLPEFVEASEVETMEKVIRRVAETQCEKLARELMNFRFGFRIVVAPSSAKHPDAVRKG